ncbi:MAG: response regulator transcription factor [Deltaproteobacteria bacterium]|nr:response regulator transcription factor [Deltaproteobacteria bacterium]
MKILVAEDEKKVRKFIRQALEEAGMVVDSVTTHSELLAALKANTYDALILDRLLQGHDTINSIQSIRKESPTMKILFLSALSDVEEKVKGLTEGADDYLGKPFHVSELLARLRTITRRPTSSIKDTMLVYEDLKIDLGTQKVFRKENRIDLTSKEFRILCLFARHPGQIFSKTSILDQAWDLNHFPESNIVEVTIANLRAKIDKGFKPLIQSRRGVGYWLGEP